MKLLNYFINNLDKYYDYLSHPLINNISKFNINDCNHIQLYGVEGSMKDYYIYYIINKLTNTTFQNNLFKLQNKTINVNNNKVEFNVKIFDTFIELNPSYRSNYDKYIITKYIVSIIKNKNYKYPRHIIVIKDFDKLNYLAYMSLRRIMELYSSNVLFICVSTNLSKIPESLKSRFLNIRCPALQKIQLNKFTTTLTNHLKLIHYNNTIINKLIKSCDYNIYKVLLKIDTDNFVTLRNIGYNNDTHNDTDNDLDIITESITKSTDIDKDPITYVDILKTNITNHLKYLKTSKKIFLVLQKNREFIYKITYFNYDSQKILETFIKIIIKTFHKYIDTSKVIKLTAITDNNIIKSNRDIYHFELYLLKIYKLFHNIH